MVAPTTTVPLYVALRSFMNPDGPTQTTLLNYATSDSLTAQLSGAQTVIVPVSTTGQAVALASLFPNLTLPLFVAIADITVPGVGGLFYTHSGAASSEKQTIGPSGFLAWMPDGATTLNTLYFDNPSSTSELVLAIAVASN
jgi:hypothetical protein